jgi:hypothetical protein
VGGWNAAGYWGIGALNGSTTPTLQIGNVASSGSQYTGTWAPAQNLNLLVGGVIAPAAGVKYPDGNTQTVAYTASAAAIDSVLSTADGDVGIGTSDPESVLDIRLPANTADSILTFGNIETGRYGWIGISNGPGEPFQVMGAGGDDLALGANNVEGMRILALNGNVGIGTTAPGAPLEVNGSVKLSANSGGSITFQDGTTQSTAYTGVICGGDYAESVDVTGNRTNYGAGDVLVIDPNAPGKFLKSAEPYSTVVLGVYSTKPGTVGRRQTTPKSADEVPMAMVGIVPTKVSAENGAIKPGDLLVTSSIPGFAMKGTDRPRMLGAVIGKALGSLESGTGVIEIGVALQ